MKNEHIVYAYGEKQNGDGYVLIIGVTDEGVKVLNEKLTLTITERLPNITDIIIFKEKDKATLKKRLQEAGTIISEKH